MKQLTVPAGLALSVLLAAGLAAQLVPNSEARRPTNTQTAMWQKLALSQGVLEGLTLERFDLVSRNAIALRNMSHSNFWHITRQADYLTKTTNFQRSVDALYLAAVDKNLDRATEAYAQVARQCVDCHRLVRTQQRKPGATVP